MSERLPGPEVHIEDIPASDAMKRTIATLVMTITLLGTVFAFLQSRANNQEARAARHSSSASLESMSAVIEAGDVVGRDNLAYNLANDHLNLQFGYDPGLVPVSYEAYIDSLSEVEKHTAAEYNSFSELTQNPRYKRLPVGQDYLVFHEDQYASSYEESEFDKQYAIERDGWRRKADTYIAVITVLAFALFLLGLSSHISPHALKPFVWAAGVIALVATVWGGFSFFREVQEPTPEAIHHFVEATVAINTAQDAEDYEHVIELASEAIGEREGYADAHLLRGNAYFDLDFFNENGPQGSERALDDFLVALEDNPNDSVAAGNVGAIHFWLDNYEASYDWTMKALALKPDDPVLLVNRVEALLQVDPAIDLSDEIATLRERFSQLPGWLRDSVLEESYDAIELAIEYRPDIAEKEAEFLEALKRMHHEIAVSLLMMGDPNPPPIDASVDELAFGLSRNKETLEISFDYDGMEAGQQWLYRTYINNGLDPGFSVEPAPFDFDVPSGHVTLDLEHPAGFTSYRFISGDVIRVEIFVEGNLLNAGEFEVP